MEFKTTLMISLLIVSLFAIPPTQAKTYKYSVSIGFVLVTLYPDTSLNLKVNDTVTGYYQYTLLANSTGFQEKGTGENVSLVVGYLDRNISSYTVGFKALYYFTYVESYKVVPVTLILNFNLIRNETKTLLPVATLNLPQDVMDQMECIDIEQNICEERFFLTIVNSNWNITFIGGLTLFLKDSGNQNDASSVVAFFIWTVVILAIIVLFIKFISK